MEQNKVQQEIEAILRQQIGLNPESIGSRAVLRAMKKGLRQSGLADFPAYLSKLKTSPALLDELIELIVVPETSFFRNRVSYSFLRQWVADEWKPRMARLERRPLRVLSLPCSSGEEPYSIAITLLEEGLALDEFHIDGVDISAVALAKARKGIFSPYAFRRRAYRKDDKYFSLAVPAEHAADGVELCNLANLDSKARRRKPVVRYVLREFVRDKVVFRKGSVLDENLLSGELPYDIVFCRNMLIYFDEAARQQTFAFLNRVLHPDGLLFIGYAETSSIDATQYQPVPYPQTFAFNKRASLANPSAVIDLKQRTDASSAQKLARQPALEANIGTKTETESDRSRAFSNGLQTVLPVIRTINGTATYEETAGRSDLEMAREFADKGSLTQATELCDRYLADHPSSADAHLLKGELHQSLGNEDAALGCFSRAVYLNPQMQEALTHLLIMHEGKGNIEKADVVRARLQRLKNT